MARRKLSKRPATGRSPRGSAEPQSPARPLRIIGGTMRGRKLAYSGEEVTRPMKQRVREAVFNLVGPRVQGKYVLDLFAGTGALGLEALSRGAAWATMFERHFPTAALIRENIAELDVGDRAEVVPASCFFEFRHSERLQLPGPSGSAWLAFCSPPWSFFDERRNEMLNLIATLLAAAPPASVVVVEANQAFSPADLPQPESWDVRDYPPARIAICETA